MEKEFLDLVSAAIEKGDESLNTITNYLSEMKYEEQRRVANIALAKAQAAFPKVDENATAGGRYKYATLDNMLGLIGPVLNQHGFAYSFDSHWQEEDGKLMQQVYCRLHHEGGHMFVATVRSPIDPAARMNESQKAGSALSYGKRYAFSAVTGCSTGPEDDDARHGGSPQSRPSVRQAKPVREPVREPDKPAIADDQSDRESDKPVRLSPAQVRRLWTIAHHSTWSSDRIKELLMERWGIESSNELTLAQYNELCDEILPGGDPNENVSAGDGAD
jgi:hypothetical protein